MTLERFEMLEEQLTKLLDGYEQMKADNQALKSALESKDHEFQQLQVKMKDMDKEKVMVRERVDKLLGRLDYLLQGVAPLQGA